MPHLLFVYGSLRSEFDNVHAVRLRAESTFAGAATVAGSVFLVGRYPGYRTEPAGVVHGVVYALVDAAKTVAHLDAYEGAEYRRIKVSLVSPAGEAWIYEYASALPIASRILSGDFTRQ